MKSKNPKNKRDKPARPPSVQDLAIRNFIQDLINRNQIGFFNEFCKDLGFKAAQQVRQFLQGKINFPKPHLEYTKQILIEKFSASPDFLNAGFGNMYQSAPYMAPVPTINQQASNILSMQGMKQLAELQSINNSLKERIAMLESLSREKSELIQQQKNLISRLDQVKTLPERRIKKRD